MAEWKLLKSESPEKSGASAKLTLDLSGVSEILTMAVVKNNSANSLEVWPQSIKMQSSINAGVTKGYYIHAERIADSHVILTVFPDDVASMEGYYFTMSDRYPAEKIILADSKYDPFYAGAVWINFVKDLTDVDIEFTVWGR